MNFSIIFLAVLFLTACSSSSPNTIPQPTNTSPPANMSIPTVTVELTDTPMPTATPKPTDTPPPTATPEVAEEHIAFVSDRDGNNAIYVINVDGSGLNRLTELSYSHARPVWSPEGTRIAFVVGRNDSNDVYVVDADGSNLTKLTNLLASHIWGPAWSPDGTQILFMAENDNQEIYVVKADGSDLTNLSNHPSSDHSPIWSPNGTRIAFVSDREGSSEIYVVNADGSDMLRRTDFGILETEVGAMGLEMSQLAWAPDDTRIAFVGTLGFYTHIYVLSTDGPINTVNLTEGEIYVNGEWLSWVPGDTNLVFTCWVTDFCLIGADGSDPTKLTDLPGFELYSQTWSPDGTRIAFTFSEDRKGRIYVLDINDSEVTDLTNYEFGEGSPTWSPDGKRIAFSRNLMDNWDIYVMNADGSNVTRLTDHQAVDNSPVWSP